jgi:hypothetical protein
MNSSAKGQRTVHDQVLNVAAELQTGSIPQKLIPQHKDEKAMSMTHQ